MSLAEVKPLPVGSLADIRRLLGQLADDCEEAEVDAVVTVAIIKGQVSVRGLGSNADSQMTYLLLGLGQREIERAWTQAAEELARGG